MAEGASEQSRQSNDRTLTSAGSAEDLRRRLGKSFAAYGITQILTVTNQLLSVPFLLTHWGKNTYAEWIVLSTLPAYMSMTDLGIGFAAANQVSAHTARGERDEARAVYQTAWVFTSLMAGLGIIFFLFTLLAPFQAWFRITQIPRNECVLVVNLLMLNVLVWLQAGVVRIPFRCTGLHSQAIAIVNLTTLLQLIAVITVACLGRGPAVLASAMLGVTTIGTAAMYIRGRQIMPWLKIGVRHADRTQFRRMVAPALSQMLFPLGTAASLQGTLMVISAILGPSAVILFSTTRTMTRMVNQLTGIVESCFGPEFSLSISCGNFNLARSLHHRASQLSLWLAVGSSLFLALAGPPIYRIWTRHALQLDYPVFYLLLLALVANGAYYGSFAVPLSVNRHVKLGPIFVGVYTAALILVAIGLNLFGLSGAAMAAVLAEVALFAAVVPVACRVAQDNFLQWVGATVSLDFRWIFSKARFGDIEPTTQAEADMMVGTIDEEADLIADRV